MSDQPINFSTILANSIHDAKNALGHIDQSLEQMKTDESLSNNAENIVKKIKLTSQSVNQNLVRVLSLYKLSNHDHALLIDEVNVRDFFEEIAVNQTPLLSIGGLTLEIQCDDDITGYFDYELIKSVLEAALHNASKFAKTTIRLTAIKDEYLIIGIEDDGPGYDADLLDESTSIKQGVSFEPGGSTGLGLFFAHQILSAHSNKNRNGSINLASSSGLGGARFSINLP